MWRLIKNVKKGGLFLILGIETTLKGPSVNFPRDLGSSYKYEVYLESRPQKNFSISFLLITAFCFYSIVSSLMITQVSIVMLEYKSLNHVILVIFYAYMYIIDALSMHVRFMFPLHIWYMLLHA